MRAIKFRVWIYDKQIENGYLTYEYFQFHRDNEGYYVYEDWRDAEDGRSRRCIPMQFIGLHDKNGREIFEGDIIKKCGYNKKERQWVKYYRVIYEYDAFCLEKDGETYAFGFSKDGKLIKEEIIGNIHENPSLINP